MVGKLALGLCRLCADGVPRPCIGKRDKALCVNHWNQEHRRSKNGKADDREFSRKKAKVIKDRPWCELRLSGCTRRAVDVHHTRGKDGGYYLDVATWLMACRSCHIKAGDNTAQSYELNISQKRLIKYE
jgi:hypothetical protein